VLERIINDAGILLKCYSIHIYSTAEILAGKKKTALWFGNIAFCNYYLTDQAGPLLAAYRN
jgi:hypothetical protein